MKKNEAIELISGEDITIGDLCVISQEDGKVYKFKKEKNGEAFSAKTDYKKGDTIYINID